MKIEVYPLYYEQQRDKVLAQLNDGNSDQPPLCAADIDRAVIAWLTKEAEAILNDLDFCLRGNHFQVSTHGFYEALDSVPCEPPHTEDDGLPDHVADADTLRMAGWGTDDFYERG